MLQIPDDVEVHDLSTSKMWFRGDIVCAVSKGRGSRSIEETKELIENFKKLTGDKKICLLIDVSNTMETPREVRDYAAEEFPKFIKAIAMLSDSALGKMIANLFFTVKHQPYPTKFFNDEEEAIKWLQQYI